MKRVYFDLKSFIKKNLYFDSPTKVCFEMFKTKSKFCKKKDIQDWMFDVMNKIRLIQAQKLY